MADTLTPELGYWLDQCIQRTCDGGDRMSSDEARAELRALLRCYQRQQETCEWGSPDEFGVVSTSCGRLAGIEDIGSRRPCWCGRKVQVTR